MRLGPDYVMQVHEGNRGHTTLPIPLELVYEFEGVEFVKWHENEDGTYTITLFDKV
jgi:hypothetical protein